MPQAQLSPTSDEYILDLLGTSEQKLLKLMDELGGKDINDVMKEMEDAEVGTYNIQTVLENLREIKARPIEAFRARIQGRGFLCQVVRALKPASFWWENEIVILLRMS